MTILDRIEKHKNMKCDYYFYSNSNSPDIRITEMWLFSSYINQIDKIIDVSKKSTKQKITPQYIRDFLSDQFKTVSSTDNNVKLLYEILSKLLWYVFIESGRHYGKGVTLMEGTDQPFPFALDKNDIINYLLEAKKSLEDKALEIIENEEKRLDLEKQKSFSQKDRDLEISIKAQAKTCTWIVLVILGGVPLTLKMFVPELDRYLVSVFPLLILIGSVISWSRKWFFARMEVVFIYLFKRFSIG